jgi:hypothetical protein
VDFLHFSPSMIRVSPTSVVSYLFPLQCRLSSGRRHHAVTPCHTSFSWSQDELVASASSSGNALSSRLPSRAEIKALNLHHHRRPPSRYCPLSTIHYYKKVILTLVTLPTTQTRLHFASSLARAPHHRSSTRSYRSLLPLSHVHHSYAQ